MGHFDLVMTMRQRLNVVPIRGLPLCHRRKERVAEGPVRADISPGGGEESLHLSLWERSFVRRGGRTGEGGRVDGHRSD